MSRTLFLAAFAAGCGWNSLPQQDYTALEAALWDPASATALDDGLYVQLPHSGGLMRLQPGSAPKLVDVGEARVTQLEAAPDRTALVAFLERYDCDVEDPKLAKEIDDVDDCPRDAMEVHSELTVVRDAKTTTVTELETAFNAIEFSDDGRFAIAYMDLTSDDLEITGIVNLTGVVVIDLIDGSSNVVSVGFAPDRILFTTDDTEATTGAVVLSLNQVALLDLASDVPTRDTTFALSLDPDYVVQPIDVDLTPDGTQALIAVEGDSILYVLDLVNKSVNIEEISAVPSAMWVHDATETAVLVFSGSTTVDMLELEFLDVETSLLDEAMTDIHGGSTYALLYSDDREAHDAYRLDLETRVLTEYRLQNPVMSMHVTPTEEFAVALTRPEDGFNDGVEGFYDQHYGMEILDLQDDDAEPFALEGEGLGVAFVPTDSALHALILQRGVEYLFQLDLYTGQQQQLELSEPPVAIGSMTDGTFFITHDSALGLVSFYDPTTDKIVEVTGFAGAGIADPIEVLKDAKGNN